MLQSHNSCNVRTTEIQPCILFFIGTTPGNSFPQPLCMLGSVGRHLHCPFGSCWANWPPGPWQTCCGLMSESFLPRRFSRLAGTQRLDSLWTWAHPRHVSSRCRGGSCRGMNVFLSHATASTPKVWSGKPWVLTPIHRPLAPLVNLIHCKGL